jgi:hypothetical protein
MCHAIAALDHDRDAGAFIGFNEVKVVSDRTSGVLADCHVP